MSRPSIVMLPLVGVRKPTIMLMLRVPRTHQQPEHSQLLYNKDDCCRCMLSSMAFARKKHLFRV